MSERSPNLSWEESEAFVLEYVKFALTVCAIGSLIAVLPEDSLRIAADVLWEDLLPHPIVKSLLTIGEQGFSSVDLGGAVKKPLDAGFTQENIKERIRRAEEVLAILRDRVAAKSSPK